MLLACVSEVLGSARGRVTSTPVRNAPIHVKNIAMHLPLVSQHCSCYPPCSLTPFEERHWFRPAKTHARDLRPDRNTSNPRSKSPLQLRELLKKSQRVLKTWVSKRCSAGHKEYLNYRGTKIRVFRESERVIKGEVVRGQGGKRGDRA